MSLFPHKRHGRSRQNHEQALLDRDPKLAKRLSLPRLSSKWRMRNFRKDFDRTGLSETSPQSPGRKKYGIEYEEFTNPWHAAASSFLAFQLVPFLQCSLSFSFQLPIAFRDGLRCWTILDLHWLYQCKTRKSTNQASHASQSHHWTSHHGCNLLLRTTL